MLKTLYRNFPGIPVVDSMLPMQGGKSLIPGLGPQILHAEWYSLKNKNKNSYRNILTQHHCTWVMLAQAESVTIIISRLILLTNCSLIEILFL